MNEISIIKLDADYHFKPFDCGNQDLNDFLLIDSKNYQKKLLSVTYILQTEKDIAAFFSVSNDKISIPKATANFFEKGNNDYSYVYVISPTYDMELVKANEFVAKEVGVYTIRYFALDVYGNYELVDFEIQVSK